MFKWFKHYISVAICFARLAIQKQIEYPLFMLSWFVMIPISYTVGLLLLYILANQFQPLAGWTFSQLAFLYGLGDISHGLMIVFAIQTWDIENFVIHGEFDRLLVRPMNVFFQFLASYVNFIGLMDILTGIVIFGYACHLIGFIWSVSNIIKIILVIIGAALIRISFYTIICSVSFWTKRSSGVFWFGHELLERTTLYPISIYPYLLQMVLTLIIPVAFISFYPACDFLGKTNHSNFPLELVIWTPIVGILMFILANFVFNTGLRKYESSGS